MERVDPRWRPWALVISLAAGVMLFATYLLPATAALWHAVDVRAAFALNGLITDNQNVQLLWSLGNLRGFDFAVGALMLLVVLHYLRYGQRATLAIRGAQMFVTCVMLVALVSITRNLIFEHLPHDSPSLVLHPFKLLSDLNDLGAKDSSHISFPGDHATVNATFVFLLWAFAGWRYGAAATVIAVVANLPRLVAGAHWFSDDMVGGVGTALLTVPFVVFTPVGPWMVGRLAPLLARLAGVGRRIPRRGGAVTPGATGVSATAWRRDRPSRRQVAARARRSDASTEAARARRSGHEPRLHEKRRGLE